MATLLKDMTHVEGHAAWNWPTLDAVSDAVRDAREAVADVRDVAKHAADRLELEARRRPVAAAGVAAGAGFIAGCVLAFGLGWFAARRIAR